MDLVAGVAARRVGLLHVGREATREREVGAAARKSEIPTSTSFPTHYAKEP